MMRRTELAGSVWLLVLLLLLTVGSSVAAPAATPVSHDAGKPEPMFALFCLSEPLGMVGDFLVPLQMFQDSRVRQELALTDIQLARLNELIEKTRAVFTEQYPASGFKGVTYEMIDRETGEARKRMMDILKPQQAERLKELVLQNYGVLSVSPRDMRQTLHLTPDQEYQIDSIRAELFSRINATLQQPLKDGSEPVCQMAAIDNDAVQALVKSAEQQVEALFSPEQSAVLQKSRQKPSSPAAAGK